MINKDADEIGTVIVILVLAFVFFITGAVIGTNSGEFRVTNKYHQEAIDRGFGQYCPQSGKWAWKDECK